MTPFQPNQEVTLILTAQEINVVMTALGEAPYKIAAPLIQKIMAQINERHGQTAPPQSPRPNGSDIHASN